MIQRYANDYTATFSVRNGGTSKRTMNGIDDIFIPHVILPSQFYNREHNRDISMPVRRLMLAVLTDALDCLRGRAINARGSARRQEARRAAEWVEQDSDRYLFSFTSVCETLGIDPDALRETLKNWPASEGRLASRFHVVSRRTRVRAQGVRAGGAGFTVAGKREADRAVDKNLRSHATVESIRLQS